MTSFMDKPEFCLSIGTTEVSGLFSQFLRGGQSEGLQDYEVKTSSYSDYWEIYLSEFSVSIKDHFVIVKTLMEKTVFIKLALKVIFGDLCHFIWARCLRRSPQRYT